MRTISNDSARFLFLLFLLIIVKATGLYIYGPIHAPDTPEYSDFADIILNETAWLHDEGLSDGRHPRTSFRAIGYPLIIALAKVLNATYWPWFIVGLQFSFSLLATVFVYRLAKLMSEKHWVALFAALCHGVGQNVVLDQTIFTNSLNGSLLLILACHMGISILSNRRLSVLEAVALGGVVLICFLIREAGLYLQIFYWPLVFFWSVRTKANIFRGVCFVVIFAIPTFVGAEAYKSWNEYRAGERYITTAARVAMFYPPLHLKWRGIQTISTDPLLVDMEPFADWRNVTTDHDIIRTRDEYMTRISNHLRDTHGFSHLDTARFLTAYFYKNWMDHPLDMLAVTLANIKPKQIFLAFRPLETAIQLRYWATFEWPWPKWGALWDVLSSDDEGRTSLLTLIALGGISRAISAVITLSFLFGVPALIVREARTQRLRVTAYNQRVVLMLLFLCLYLGYTLVYAMVSLELRYLMPVAPLAMITGLVLVSPYIEKMHQFWKAHRL